MGRCKECNRHLLDDEMEYCQDHIPSNIIDADALISRIEQYREDLKKIGWMDNRMSTVFNTIIKTIK